MTKYIVNECLVKMVLKNKDDNLETCSTHYAKGFDVEIRPSCLPTSRFDATKTGFFIARQRHVLLCYCFVIADAALRFN